MLIISLSPFHTRKYIHTATHLIHSTDAVMLFLNTTTAPCYFTISPPTHKHHYTSSETLSYSPTDNISPAEPENPLLAYRARHSPSTPATPSTMSFMQVQTSAAQGRSMPTRPRPYPVQNVLHVGSDDSVSSDDSNSSVDSNLASLPELARCSRCQRTPSLDLQTRQSNMISYGLNLWYCTRCAAMVGLTKR